MANLLPTAQEIEKWSDERLNSTIKAGEAINWQCGINETQQQIDSYVESVYFEQEKRLRNSNPVEWQRLQRVDRKID